MNHSHISLIRDVFYFIKQGEIALKKLHKLLLAMLIIIGLVAGCNNAPDEGANQTNDTSQTGSTEEESYFPVTVEDSNGDEITLEEEPEKIVSLMPSNTEIAFALGLGDKIVGVSDHDNYPEEALDKEKIGGLELNTELILSLEPDLVFAHPGNGTEGVDQLREAGLTVFVVNDASAFEEVYDTIGMMSEVTGVVEEGDKLIEAMKEGFTALSEKAEAVLDDDMKTVFIEISPSPEIYTPGNNTFENEILSLIHAKNGAGDEDGWVMLSEEAIVEMNPDVIIVTYDYTEDPVGEVMSRDAWQDIEAIKNDQVIQVDTDIVSRPGPRLVEGAEVLAKEIYPEVFGEE